MYFRSWQPFAADGGNHLRSLSPTYVIMDGPSEINLLSLSSKRSDYLRLSLPVLMGVNQSLKM